MMKLRIKETLSPVVVAPSILSPDLGHLHLCDIALVMTVNPGFSGQKFLPEMLRKIRRLRETRDARGLDPFIAVDGGENRETAGQAIEAGANATVAGSAIFGSQDYAAAIAAIRDAARPLAGRALA
jgi:ribulose-phosphate 3-epimerase